MPIRNPYRDAEPTIVMRRLRVSLWHRIAHALRLNRSKTYFVQTVRHHGCDGIAVDVTVCTTCNKFVTRQHVRCAVCLRVALDCVTERGQLGRVTLDEYRANPYMFASGVVSESVIRDMENRNDR